MKAVLVSALLCATATMDITSAPQAPKMVVEISIPKCGTHLVNKCLSLLGRARTPGSPARFVLPPQSFAKTMSLLDNKYWVGHLVFKPEYATLLGGDGYAPIFVYRDPRDHVVSYAYHMKKRAGAYPKAVSMTIDELITDQLTVGIAYGGQGKLYRNVDAAYKTYLPWMELPNMLIIRFEDLIGLRGGGSDALQLATIKNIANHIGAEADDAKLREVMEKLFGPSMTFREGTIGSWKKHFTTAQKQQFKVIAGQLLIDLGYEKDFNW